MNQGEQHEFNCEMLVVKLIELIKAIIDDKVTYAHTDTGNWYEVDRLKRELKEELMRRP